MGKLGGGPEKHTNDYVEDIVQLGVKHADKLALLKEVVCYSRV